MNECKTRKNMVNSIRLKLWKYQNRFDIPKTFDLKPVENFRKRFVLPKHVCSVRTDTVMCCCFSAHIMYFKQTWTYMNQWFLMILAHVVFLWQGSMLANTWTWPCFLAHPEPPVYKWQMPGSCPVRQLQPVTVDFCTLKVPLTVHICTLTIYHSTLTVHFCTLTINFCTSTVYFRTSTVWNHPSVMKGRSWAPRSTLRTRTSQAGSPSDPKGS